ncbi:MAG: hypothetical protein AB7O97_04015 [Planctomycetota bacterium]
MRSIAVPLMLLLFAGCKTLPPVTTTPSFVTYPALATHNPADIAVLPIEDGTPDRTAARHLEFMRQVVQRRLPERLYSPLTSTHVDAALMRNGPGPGETTMTPAYLKRVAGKATEDALLAVRVDLWDESRLLSDKRVEFRIEAALMANDGELLWSGNLAGTAKAGGLGPAPRDVDAMARSCAELALTDVLNHLSRRLP